MCAFNPKDSTVRSEKLERVMTPVRDWPRTIKAKFLLLKSKIQKTLIWDLFNRKRSEQDGNKIKTSCLFHLQNK
jgi:hypothetical protein